MLTVGLDVTAGQRLQTTGWERLSRALYRSLTDVTADRLGEIEIAGLGWQRNAKSVAWDQLRALLWATGGASIAARRAHAAVYHSPANPPPTMNVPVAWTLHDDMLLGGHPEFAPRSKRWMHPLARRAARHAAAIIATNNSVRDDIIKAGVDESVITVIPPGRTKLPTPRPLQRPLRWRMGESSIPSEFALSVGTICDRKDPHAVARGAELAGIPVIFAGDVGVSEFHFERLLHFDVTHIAGAVSDAELAWLMSNASVLISASHYEGMDLPTVEAIARGTPVAASDIPVHRDVLAEVIGKTVHLFEVGDGEQACAAIENAIASAGAEPRELLPKWDEVARQHVALYESLVA